jgi:pimeloyl-ACP methyl ester carboxylesterase
MPFFEHSGIRFRFEILGEGPPDIVFTHGLNGSHELMKDLLGQENWGRLILWDVRFHGGSEPPGPAESLHFPTLADDLHALVEHLSLDRFILGGVSMGAAIGTAYTVAHPDRVRALVLNRPAWTVESNPPNLALLPLLSERLKPQPTQEDLEWLQDRPEFKDWVRYSGATAQEVWNEFSDPEVLRRKDRFLHVPRSRPITSWEEVENLTQPTLVVGNHRDAAHPWEMAVEWAEHLPNARLVEVPSKLDGLEAQHLAFRDHFRSFLKEVEKNQ